MVRVGSALCVDRYEAHIVDRRSGHATSPYYSANPLLAVRDHAEWVKRSQRTGPYRMHDFALPPLPEFQRETEFVPVARSEPDVLPSAYVDYYVARKACANADKRLCTHDEWLSACRGSERRRYPYGLQYEPGRCNVTRGLHPASVLHTPGDFGGTDPRMNLVSDARLALLLRTGTLDECVSPWDDDGIYDMVGNLDEWVEDPRGTFLGGFYARDMPWGCDARIDIHSADYYDYSTGFRCCRDALKLASGRDR